MTADRDGRAKGDGWADRAADGLAAAAFAAGGAAMVFATRGVPPDVFRMLAYALAAATVLVLSSHRSWILPSALAVLLSGALVFAWSLGTLPDTLASLGDFALRSATFLLRGEPTGPWLTSLRFLVTVPIALLAWLLVRRAWHLPLFALLAAAAAIPFLVFYPSGQAAVLPLLGGLAMMLPRYHLQRIDRHRAPGTPPSTVPRAPMQFLAAPVVLLCLALAQVAIPADTGQWRWAGLLNHLADIRDLFPGRTGDPRAIPSFDLSALGFLPLETRLGGPVSPAGWTLLEVTAPEAQPIRGTSKSVYTGTSWQRSPSDIHRFDSLFWTGIRSRTFGQDLPAGRAGRDFLRDYSRPVTFRIRSLYLFQSTVFGAGRVRGLALPDPLNPAYFNDGGDLFVLKPLARGGEYQVETLVLDRSLPGFEAAMVALEERIAGETDGAEPDAWTAGQVQAHLQLPDGLPEAVRAAARRVAGDEASPYRIALRLESHFRTGYRYTLDPAVPPAGQDFTAHFLETREGYCVYFATAMAVMARTLGLPSRYVEGFLLERNTRSGSLRATGETAHAWVEIYFAGIGWLSFDPTPPGGEPLTPTPTPAPSPTPGGATSAPTPAPTPTPEPTPSPTPTPGAGGLAVGIPLLSAGILLLFLGFAALFLRIRHTLRLDPARLRRRLPDPGDRLVFLYRDLLRQLDCLGVAPEPGETMLQFARRADGFLRMGTAALPDLLWPVARLHYGDLAVTEDEAEALSDLGQQLELRLREALSVPAYFLRRVLPAAAGWKGGKHA